MNSYNTNHQGIEKQFIPSTIGIGKTMTAIEEAKSALIRIDEVEKQVNMLLSQLVGPQLDESPNALAAVRNYNEGTLGELERHSDIADAALTNVVEMLGRIRSLI